ncbi:MAG: YkgJ family cysteine cluster protein [Steroidobacteraceae bacterium]
MTQEPETPTATIDAGAFGAWLSEFRESLSGHGGTNVPCGECVGCCVSSYSILVRPEDTQALAAISADLLTRVPALGEGVQAMGYLSDGRCPMLQAGQCSIYSHRPQTCRDYDCRVFAAAGIDAGENKPVINKRVREWRFTYASEQDRAAHRAVRAAATFIVEHHAQLPEHRLPKNPSGIAVLAVKSYEVFLDDSHARRSAEDMASAIVNASRRFDAGAQSRSRPAPKPGAT